MAKGINKVSGPLPVLQPNLGHPLVQGKYCKGCHYQHTGGRRIEPDGSGVNGIMLVGDSPWKEEIAANRNFSGAAGRWLDSILTKRGLDRNDFTVTNSTWCAPPALGYNDEPWKYPAAEYAQKQCRPYLDEYVSKHVPKVFVALGNVALRRLTGFDGIEGNHAYVIPSVYDSIPTVPTFHPSSFLQGNWRYTIAFILALAKAVEISNGTYNETKLSIIEDPPPTYLDRPGNSPIPSMMCDIETPRSLQGKDEEESEDDPSYNIIRMGFSVSPWYGCSFPFEGDYIRRAKELVRRTRVLIFWNKNYDLPRLKANGFELHPDVIIIDAMWAWHFLYSDLPKALQFAAPFFYNGKPWKHLHSQRPAFYNGCDNAIQMGVFEGTKAQLIKDGRWDRFYSHCVKTDPIYVSMGSAGVKVDTEARIPFMQAMENEALVELKKVQELLPPKLIKVEESFKPLKQPVAGYNESTSQKLIKSLVTVTKGEVPTQTKDGTYVLSIDNKPVMRPIYRRYIPFNPNSRDSLLELMRELKVKIPKARGDDRESTEAKYLKRLTKYPIFRHVINYKQKLKLLATYNWKLYDAEITTFEEVAISVKAELGKLSKMVGISGTGDAKTTYEVPKVQGLHGQTSLKVLPQPSQESKTRKGPEESLPKSIWGSWVGNVPSSEELSKVPSVLSGREALHPSLGLGQIKQELKQLHSDLYFVPYEISSEIRTNSHFLLPIKRTITSSDRARTTYGFHPSTWRSSSRNDNLGNIPKRYELAKLFRRLLVAERGHKLIEIDRSGLEAVLVGYWAKSPEYIKLAKAGVHSYLGSIILGQEVPWSVIRDTPLPELKKILKVFKKLGGDDYEGWKRCVHGSSYLLSPFGMHDEYEEYFPTEYAAQKVQDILFSSPAGQAIRQYHKMTLDEVQHKKYLDNSFQYRHYFWGPLYKFNKRDKRWVVDHEGDAKRAIAFRPQSDGAAIQREDLLGLNIIDYIRGLIRLPTYDSIILETPHNLVDKSIEALANQFNKPIPELGGLDIGFEIKVGDNLAEMEEVNT